MTGVCSKVYVVLLIFTVSTSYAIDFDNVSDSFCLSCRSRKHSKVDEGMKIGKLTPDIAKTDNNKRNKIQNEGKNNTIESNLDSQSQNSSNLFNNYILAQFQEQNNPQEYDDLNSSQDLNIHQDYNVFGADDVKINLSSGNSSVGKIKNLNNDKLLGRKRGKKTKIGKNLSLSKSRIKNIT